MLKKIDPDMKLTKPKRTRAPRKKSPQSAAKEDKFLMLLESRGELSRCHLSGLLNMDASTVSKIARQLIDAGKVVRTERGNEALFKLAQPARAL